MLTVDGDRAMDGNWATAWWAERGSSFVAQWNVPRTVHQISVARSCTESTGAATIKIFADDWTVVRKLDENTRYYQPVEVPGKPTRRIRIEFLSVDDSFPVCIGEIQFSSEKLFF